MSGVVFVIPKVLAYGPRPNSKTIDYLADTFSIIVNLRPETEHSHWYAKKEEVQTVHSFNKFDTTTQTVKSRDLPEFRKLCHRVVVALTSENQTVYIHDMDGKTTAPFLVSIVWYWYNCSKGFDPIAERRREFDFRFMKNKAQCAQFKKLKATIHSTMLWSKLVKEKQKKKIVEIIN